MKPARIKRIKNGRLKTPGVPLRIISMNDLHGKIDQQYELDLNGDGKPDGTFGRMDYAAAYIKRRKPRKNTPLSCMRAI